MFLQKSRLRRSLRKSRFDVSIKISRPQKNVLGDIHYSMLPVSAKPLWGIVMNRKAPQLHADYQFYRDKNKGVRREYFELLLGDRPIDLFKGNVQ